jgi:hypothetical protein
VQLRSLRLQGWRRFGDASVNLQDKVIAILGPNEAGKSSILEALGLFNDDKAVAQDSLTRGIEVGDTHELLTARFRLTDGERVVLPFAVAPSAASWLFVIKTVGGRRIFRLDPPVATPNPKRQPLQAEIEAAVTQDWFVQWQRTAAGEAAKLTQARDEMRGSAGDLSVKLASAAATAIRKFKTNPTGAARKIPADKLLALLDLSAKPSSPDAVDAATRAVLLARMPKFLMFNETNRLLASSYDLGGLTAPARPNALQPPSPAWLNLAAMLDLDLPKLAAEIKSKNHGAVQTTLDRARQRSIDALHNAWTQQGSKFEIGLIPDGLNLNITVRDEAAGNYFKFEQRSDGVRTFVALRAFLAREHAGKTKPVLLVDEAERNLHYDAQADLIRVFEAQADAAQVIYTTHSVGCLPEDLGRGVRVIRPTEGSRSEVQNHWSSEQSGVSPLVAAMGGVTVPLSPARFIVVCEGTTDALLYPSLLRAATDQRPLGYQMVGGLSTTKQRDLPSLLLEAPLVAFLTDGDPSGKKIGKHLRQQGIAEAQIHHLPDTLTLEDLVDAELFAEAVNRVLASWSQTTETVSAAGLPAAGRWKAIERWCAAEGITRRPTKETVAEEIILLLDERHPDAPIVEASRKSDLQEIHEGLVALFTSLKSGKLPVPSSPETSARASSP